MSEKQPAHELRAEALAKLRVYQREFEAIVQEEGIAKIPTIAMAIHYVLMELNLDNATRAGEIPDPVQVLRELFSMIDVDRIAYEIRDDEGQGWSGPRVVRFGEVVSRAQELLR